MARRMSTAAVLLAWAAVLLAGSAAAATITWDASSATDLSWDTITNWSGDSAEPTASDDVVFPTPIPNPGLLSNPNIITLTSGELANSLAFYDSYTLSGGDLTLTAGNGGVVNVTTGNTATIGTQLIGTAGLTKQGRGVLVLSNSSNSYTGTTTISMGSVIVTNQGALGSDTSAVLVTGNNTRSAGGGNLTIGGGITFTRALDLTGSGMTGDAAAFTSLGSNTISGDITTGANPTGVTATGTAVTNPNTLLTSAFGTTTISSTNFTTVGTGTTYLSGKGNWVVSSDITGTGALYKTGAGTAILTGSNTFSGIVTVSGGGSLRVAQNSALGSSTAASALTIGNSVMEFRSDAPDFNTRKITQANTGTIFVDRAVGGSGINQTVNLGAYTMAAAFTQTISGRNGYKVTFSSVAGGSLGGDNGFTNSSNGLVTFTGDMWGQTNGTARTLTLGGNGEMTITGSIKASGAAHDITKSGNGTLIVSGTASTYTGVTRISGGTLSIADFRSVNASSQINIGSGTTAGALTLTGSSATYLQTSKVINLAATTTGGAIINANNTGNPVILTSAFTNAGTTKTLYLGGTSTLNNEIQGAIVTGVSGTTSLTKVGAGTWVLSGTNTYTGSTTISQGTLKISDRPADINILSDTAAIVFNSISTFGQSAGGTFNYVGWSGGASSELVGALTPTAGAGTVLVTPGGGTTTLTFASMGTRTAGATLNFGPTGVIKFTTAPPLNNGIVSTASTGAAISYATFNGVDWATVSAGTVSAYTSYTADLPGTGGSTATNYSDTRATVTTTAAVSANSLKLAPATGAQTVTLGGILTLDTGGLLFDNTSFSSVINNNGTAANTLGQANKEIVIITNGSSAANTLTVNALIGSGTGSLTKAGSRTLIVGGANTYTGNTIINEGTVKMATGGTLGAITTAGNVTTLRQGATLDLNGVDLSIGALQGAGTITNTGTSDATLTMGILGTSTGSGAFAGIIQDGATNKLSVVKNTSGTASMPGLNTYTGPTTLSAGTWAATTLANIGVASSIGKGDATSDATNAASLVFNGGTLQYTGVTAAIYQTTQTPTASINRLFTLAGNGTIDSSGVYGNVFGGTGTANNASLIFNNTGTVAFSGVGPRTLTLTGSSTGDNQIALKLVDLAPGDNLSVTKAGAGLWYLSNTNTYSGNTTISQGVLRAQDGTGLPSTSALVLGTTTTSGVLEASGSFTRSVAASATPGAVTWGGTTGGGGFAASDSDLTVNLGGSGATLTWAGGAGFVPNGAPLVFNSTTALAEVTFVNGIDLNGANRTIQVDDNGVTWTDRARITGVISDSSTGGALTKTGSGLLILGNANTYTGNTAVNGGTLWVTSLGNLSGTTSSSVGASGGKITMSTGAQGTLTYGGPGETSDRLIELAGTNLNALIEASGTGALVLSNVSNVGTGARNLYLRGDSYANNELTGGTAVLADGGGALSVVKDDYGTWILSGQNTYTGATTFSLGALGIGADSAGSAGAPTSGPVGVGTLALANGSLFAARADRTVLNNVTLANNSTSAAIGEYSLDLAGTFTLVAGTSNMTLSNGIVAGKTLTISGNIITGDTARNEILNINGSGKTIISGAITDNSTTTDFFLNLTYAGYGELVLSNTGNSYTGTTTISNGKLTLGANEVIPHGLGGSSGTLVQGNVVMNPAVQASPAVTFTATLDMNGKTETISGLTATSAGNIVIDNSSASAASLTFGANNQDVNITSTVGQGTVAIKNTGGGALSLTKTGSGTATISNASELSYTGSTSVTGGTMIFNSDVSGTTGLSVTGNGILRFLSGLSASGSITSVTVDGGSTLNLSNLAGEALSSVTAYSLAAGTGTTTLWLDLGTTSDTIGNATSTVTLGANTIDFRLGAAGGITGSTTYDLLLASIGLNAGTYNLAAEPSGFTAGTLTVDTVGGTWVRYTTGTLITSDAYWTNDQATGSWSTNNAGNTNWDTDATSGTDVGATPGLGTNVYFSANAATGTAISTTLDADMNINKLTFTASPTGVTSVTIAAGTPSTSKLIVNGGGIDVQSNAGSITISSTVMAAATQDWTVDGTGANGSMLTISGALSGSGVISKKGGGRLVLGGTASNYTASSINVDAGSLELTNATALGGATGATVNINTGGKFYTANATALIVANPLNLNGGTLSASGNSQTYSGATSVSLDSFVVPVDPLLLPTETGRNTYLTGVVSGSGKITVNSAATVTNGNKYTGSVVFSNFNPSWSGGLQLNTGTVFARRANALGTGAVNVEYGRIILDSNTPNGTTWSIANAITVDGTGTTAVLELNPDNSSTSPAWPGGFTANFTGLITLGGSGAAPALRINEADIGSQAEFTGGIQLKANSIIHAVGPGVYTAPNVIIGTTGISESGGSFSLTINGDTTWNQNTNFSNIQIDVASSYSGGTNLAKGRLILNHLQGIGTVGDLTMNTAFLRLGVDMSGVNAFTRNWNINGNPTLEGDNFEVTGTTTQMTGSRTITNSLDSGKVLTLAGAVKLSTTGDPAGQVLTLAGARSTTISGIISDGDGTAGNGLSYTGSATLTLSGANTFTGPTTVNNNAGTLLVNSGSAIGTGALTVTAGILDLQNGSQSVTTLAMGGGGAGTSSQIKLNTGTLTLGGDVTFSTTGAQLGATIENGVLALGASTRTFTVADATGAANDMTISAQITGTLGLNKAGAGRLLLSNTANSFVGPISLGGGTLAFTTVANIGAGSSTLGAPANSTDGTIGLTASTTLSFEGSTSQSTDRPFSATAGTLTLVSAGTGGADITYAGALNMAGSFLTLIGPGTGTISGGIAMTGTAADVTINSGTWNFSTGTITVADDVVIAGSTTVANFNSTGVYAGVAGNTSNGWYIRTGGTLNLNANDVNGAANSGGLDFVLTDSGIGTLNTNGYNFTTPRLDAGTTTAGNEGYFLGSGTITVTTTLNLYRGSIAANLAGAAALLKGGAGTVTLSGNNSGLTGTTRADAGDLILDFTTDNNAKLSSGALDLRGGTLVMNGNASAASSQSVSGTTLTNGASRAEINPGSGQTATFGLGAFTRAANAGILRLAVNASGGVFTTTTANTNGMIGGWLTLTDASGTAFAANDGSGNIVAATMASQNDVNLWATNDNVTDSGTGYTGTRSTDVAINSIRFNRSGGASTATIGSGVKLTIASGGILATDTIGGTATLTGGTIAPGSGNELIITNTSTTQQLVIGSTIAGAASVTKAGLGTLVLNSTNSQYFGGTVLVNGTLIAQGGSGVGDFSTLTLADDTDVTFQLGASEAIGSLATGGSTLFNTLVVLGNNTLTINQGGGGTFSGQFTGGATSKIIKQGTPGIPNAGNLAIGADITGFSGTVQVDGGLFQLYTSGRMAAATGFTVNKNGALLIDYNTPTSVTLVGDKIGDTTPVTLNSADGAYSGGTEVRGLNIRNDSTNTDRTESIGVLTFNSGASYVSLDAPGSNYSYINATNFVRNNKATLDVRGRALGGTAASRSRLYIRDATNQTNFATNNLVGGGGATGTATMSIVPWAIGEAMTGNTGNANMGNSLVTYLTASSRGFVPLDFATEYSTYATAGDTNNVRESLTTDVTGLSGRTLNALVINNANTGATSTINITASGAGQNLVNTSGAFLFTLNPAATASSAHNIVVSGFGDNLTDPGITVGAGADYNVFVVNPSAAANTPTLTVTINSLLTSASAALVKSGRGRLVLGQDNTFGGGTYLNEGSLEISSMTRINSGNITFNGGTLRFPTATVFDPSTSTLTFGPGGAGFDTNGNNITLANAVGNSGTGGLTKSGTGTLVLSAANTFTGNSSIDVGTVELGNNSALGTGTVSLNGTDTFLQLADGLSVANQLYITNNGNNKTLALKSGATSATFTGAITTFETSAGNFDLSADTSGTLTVNGIIQGTAASGIAKVGAGTVVLGRTNTYTGVTIVDAGTLQLATGVNQDLAGGLTFGTADTITTTGIFDATNANATFAGALLVQTNNASTANEIKVGSGKTLAINNNVTLGSNGTASTTLVNFTGGGTMNVTNAAAGALFTVGGNDNAGNKTTADMSGLGTLNVSLNTTDGLVQVNPTNDTNVAGNFYSTFVLPTTTNITAATLTVGGRGQFGGNAGQVNQLKLGSGVSTIHVNTVNIGTGSRDLGSIAFNGGTGSLVLRDAAGTGRVAFNMGTGTATTATALGGNQNTFDVTGHSADLLLSAVTIGTQNRNADLVNVFSFDTGTLDMTSLTMSTKGTNGNTTTSTMNLGGGTVNIGTGSGTAATLATNTGPGTATATMNITGGTTTVTGNIVRGANSGGGTATGTVNLNGGTLNMSGFSIGSATNLITLTAQSGTLQNLAELNGGGALTKSSAGTLILAGTNGYTGGTVISDGTLQISASTLGASTGSLTVNAGMLDVNGTSQTAGNLTGTGGTIANNATGTNVNLVIGYAGGTGGNYAGVIADNTSGTGTIALVKTGDGTITLSGTNTFTGSTTISGTLTGGTLAIVADSGLGTAPLSPTPGHLTLNDGRLAANETFELNANRGITLGGSAGGQLNVADTKTLTYNGVIASAASQGLQKAGLGTLILGGSNTHTGGTLVSSGVLVMTNAAALGTTSAGVQVDGGGTLALDGGINVTGAGNLSLSGDGAVSGYGALVNISGNNTFAGNIDIPSAAGATRIDSKAGKLTISGSVVAGSTSGNFNVGGVGDVEISGIISGTMPFFKTSSGAGTVTLSGTNSYTGTTTVGNGYLKVSSEANLGTTPGTYVANQLVLRNGGGLQTSADMAISVERGITLGSGSTIGGVFNTDTATTLTVNSIIAGAGTDQSLTKVGAGTLILNGANTYTGNTNVNAGVLILGSTGSLNSTGTIAINNGSTFTNNASGSLANVVNLVNGTVNGTGTFDNLDLSGLTSGTISGTGTINSAVTIGSGVTLSPGTSPGLLQFNASQTWASGGTYQWEVNSVTLAGGDQSSLRGIDPGFDAIDIIGGNNLDITATSGSTYTIDITSLPGLTFNNMQSYSWLIASVSGSVTGFSADKFNLSTANFAPPLAGGSFGISNAGGGITLTYSPVPEPSTIAMLVGGVVMGLGGMFWRRKRRQEEEEEEA